MIALYLIAAHLVGDFVLQTRWQAAGKSGWTHDACWLRTKHVAAYCLPFIPIIVVYGHGWKADPYGTHFVLYRLTDDPTFIVALFVLHWLTDSRRFQSTLGDWVGWRRERVREVPVSDPAAFHRSDRITMLGASGRVVGHRVAPDGGFAPVLDVAIDLPPNPWAPIPILIDQTLHVCQLAVLGGLFLT